MSNFRVILHLHQFFVDHRSSCRLFITSKIKTIADLREHVSNVFELPTDFYLISDGLYLPSSEDVRVLKEDDVVTAVPRNPQKVLNSICDSKLEFQNASSHKTAKRRRSICNGSELEVLNSQCMNAKKKKKKKKSKDSENENFDCTNIETIVLADGSADEKKDKKSKIESNSCNENKSKSGMKVEEKQEIVKKATKIYSCSGDDSERLSDYSKINTISNSFDESSDQKQKIFNLDASLNKNTQLQLVMKNNLEKPFITRNKSIELMKISTKPKIIQTIHVCDSSRNKPKSVLTPHSEYFDSSNKPGDHITATQALTNIPINTSTDDWSVDRQQRIKHLSNENRNQEIVQLSTCQLFKGPPNAESEELNENFKTSAQSENNENVHENQTELQLDETKNNEEIPPQSLSEYKDMANEEKISNENSITPYAAKLNIEPKIEHGNVREKVKIISIKTIGGEQNQANTEQLYKNKAIGPQLIPVTKDIKMLDTNMCINEEFIDDSSLHLVLRNNTKKPSQEVNSESVIDFRDCAATALSESVTSSVTEESSMDLSTGIKRKRKRVRKRKTKSKTQENGFEIPVVNPKPVFTPAAPAMHIRFDENEQNESKPPSVTPDVIDISLDYEKLCKEEIVKYPIMKDKLPKQGDVIAFKICMLSKSYTPEISDVIIAKVLNYCSASNNVSVKILEGADQFCTPEGKFYMESCDVDDKQEDKDFAWGELIEPRLLFP